MDEIPRITIFASDLSKKTAKAMKYLRLNPQERGPATEAMKLGQKFAEESTISQYIEMSGKYSINNIDIYFALDEIRTCGDHFEVFEHKATMFGKTDFHLKRSIFQVVIYHTLFIFSNKSLKTASFIKDSPVHLLNLEGFPVSFYLNFGGDIYKIEILKASRILKFILEKVRASLKYETAMEFDKKYNRKELSVLKDFYSAEKQ